MKQTQYKNTVQLKKCIFLTQTLQKLDLSEIVKYFFNNFPMVTSFNKYFTVNNKMFSSNY